MTDDVLQPLKTNRVRLSVQAQQYLLDLIEDGTYEPGVQLPSENELATQLGISRPTLREALRNLEQEGAVVRKHGVGTFIAPGYAHRLEGGLERLESILELAGRQGLQPEVEALEIEEEPANRELAEKLQLAPGTRVTHVQRVIVVDKTPVAYMSDIVPSSVLAPVEIDDAFNGSVLDLLRQKQDLQMGQAVADIVALSADAVLAKKLKVKAGQAILLMEEVVFDWQGVPVDSSRNYFIPEFFRFHVVRR
jgi:GntR family transcriptional regulator